VAKCKYKYLMTTCVRSYDMNLKGQTASTHAGRRSILKWCYLWRLWKVSNNACSWQWTQ